MNYRNLIQGHVVSLILSFPTHCKFPNYGGKEDGMEELHARILNSFTIPETGHLQTCYTGKRLSMKKVVGLITELVDKDHLEDVIDVWKEICNHSDISDLRLMGYCDEIEQIGIKNGYGSQHFLHIVAPALKYSQFSSIEDFYKQAVAHTERAISARSIDGCEYHIDKLKRVLVTCPCIQAYFIGEMFDQKLLDELAEESTPSERTDILVAKIKLAFEINSNKEGTKIMHENMKAMHAEEKEGFQVWKQETIYEGKERFVHFMGTEHLTHSVIHFTPNEKRIDQECTLVHEALVSLMKQNSDYSADYIKGLIKSVIHRSFDQEKICRNVLILPHAWADFEKADPRKRGMIIDTILDETADFPKPEFETQPKEEVKENKGMGKYLDIIKEVHPDLWAELVYRQAKGEQLTEEIINKAVMKTVTSNMFGVNPTILKKLAEDGDIVSKLEGFVEQLNLSFKALTGIDPTELKGKLEQENFSSENIVRGFDFPFLSEAKCEDPACPVHGKELREHQQRVVDLIIGIDPALEGRISFLNVDPNLGKRRQQGSHDFSGMLKFLTNHFEPKPTATEIETTSNVVINQKFIINDVNGNFFCEYKMVWTPSHTRFMYSHTKPDGKQPRAFRQIAEAGGQMTQDEAFRKFQSMRRVALENPHQSKQNPQHGY